MQEHLGEILLRQGRLSESELRMALLQQRALGLPLGRTLVQDHICTENDVARALSVQAGLSFIELDREKIDPSMAALLPAKFARERCVVPLRLDHGRHDILHVAVRAPANMMTIDDVRAASGKARVIAHLAADTAIARALWRLYPGKGPVDFASSAESPMMLYGFNHVELSRLEKKLKEHGMRAHLATPHDLLASGPQDLLLAPLDAIEQLLPPAYKLDSNLIAVGEDPGRDHPRAEALGARGFVVSPIDPDLLLRTIRRFRPAPSAERG